MLDVLTTARHLLADSEAGQEAAIATIIAAEGSVPRPIGTSMLVEAAGTVHGSLTGGCVEAAVLDACLQTLSTGNVTVQRFGYSDDDAFAVGLMCGGTIDVLVQPLAAESALMHVPEHGAATAVVLRLPSSDGDRSAGAAVIGTDDGHEADVSLSGTLEPIVGPSALDSAVRDVSAMIRGGSTGTVRIAAPDDEPIDLFVETRTPPAHLVIFGANAFGRALVEAAGPLGHRITLCDPRPAFTDPKMFPGAEVLRQWPHRYLTEASEAGDLDARSMICVLTHDPKVDTPALVVALGLDVAYVGAMGSRRSDRDRRSALREAGVDEAELARLHSPIGLGLSAATPAEVAVSILAEMLAVRGGHTEIEPLSRGNAELHRNPRRPSSIGCRRR